jgi:hypothetical protein
MAGRINVVAGHPFADGKTEVNYAPPRPTAAGGGALVPLDTVVLSRCSAPNLSATLTSWIGAGFSCHAILLADGGVVFGLITWFLKVKWLGNGTIMLWNY